ncbi:unnamed protein product [Ascophyllum nodosum]
MASDMATRRLRKELMAIKRTPVDNIVAAPLESNILEWHYVITGTKGSPYEGGFYHGKLKFPPEYPMKPPSVMMLTPNGRFACSRRLCLSMSDFHPESWNPMWSVSTILMGLYSFMLDTTATLGSVTSTTAQKKKFAAESLEFNCKNSAFRKLFPDLVELNERRKQGTSASSSPPGGSVSFAGDLGGFHEASISIQHPHTRSTCLLRDLRTTLESSYKKCLRRVSGSKMSVCCPHLPVEPFSFCIHRRGSIPRAAEISPLPSR